MQDDVLLGILTVSFCAALLPVALLDRASVADEVNQASAASSVASIQHVPVHCMCRCGRHLRWQPACGCRGG